MSKIDWAVLDKPGVDKALTDLARNLAREYPNVTEQDDLLQDARLIAGENGTRLLALFDDPNVGDPLNVIYTDVRRDLLDALRTKASQARRNYSFEALREGVIE